MALPPSVTGQEAVLEIVPLRAFSFDASFNDRTFSPTRRIISIQVGLTAIRYGPLELRGIYQAHTMIGWSVNGKRIFGWNGKARACRTRIPSQTFDVANALD
jgi:hypothetical protein